MKLKYISLLLLALLLISNLDVCFAKNTKTNKSSSSSNKGKSNTKGKQSDTKKDENKQKKWNDLKANVLELQLNEYTFGSFDMKDDMHFYEVKIPSIIDTKMLIFIAKGITPDSEPELFVSSDGKILPKDFYSADFYANSAGFSMIYLDEKTLKKQDSLVYIVGVRCTLNCHYELTAFYEKDTTLDMNSQRYIVATEESHEVQINVKKGDYRTFIAEFELMNPFEVQDTFDAYFNWAEGNIGLHSPTKNNAKREGLGWGSGNGQGLMTLSDDDICEDCSILVSLIAPTGSVIRINTFSYSDTRNIQPFEIVNDFNKQKEPKIFHLELDEERYHFNPKEIDIVISLVMFQGDSDLYVNENDCPSDVNDFQYSSTQFGDDRIVISPQGRKDSVSKYCIMTYSEQNTLFSLNIFPLATMKFKLPFDYPEQGVVQNGEILNYKLTIRGETDQDFAISLKLTQQTGHSQLFVKQCNVPVNECQITKQDILKKDDEDSGLKYIHDSSFLQTLDFLHDPQNCHTPHPDAEKNTNTDLVVEQCTYVVGILGNGEDYGDESKFTILATHDLYHTTLVEGHQYHDYVEYGHINYYKYELKNNDNVKQLKFQVTRSNGEVTVISSTDEKYPDVNNKDMISFIDVIAYTKDSHDEDLIPRGMYYIGVQGDHSVSLYSIVVIVERTDESVQQFYKLSEDNPLEITMKKGQKQFFKFRPNHNINEDVQVTVQRLNGKFHFYIATEQDLLPEKWIGIQNKENLWSSHHKQIVIQQDQITEDTGYLYGVIFPNTLDYASSTKDIFRCSITYHQGNVKTLKLNHINEIFMHEMEVHYYRINLLEHDSISITKQFSGFDQSSLQIQYFVTDQGHLESYPSDSSPEMKDFEPLVISEDEIKKNCPEIDQEDADFSGFRNKCYIYLTVQVVETGIVNIYAVKNSENLLVFPNISQHLSLQKVEGGDSLRTAYKKQIYMFISSTTPKIEVSIDSHLQSHAPRIQYYFQDIISEQEKKDWKWPSDRDQQETNEIKNHFGDDFHTYLIDQDEFKKCLDNDIFLIKCALLVEIIDEYSFPLDKEPSIEVTISTGHKYLTEGKPVKSTIPKNGIDTYEFTIFENSADEIIIEASVQNHGKVSLFLEKTEFDKDYLQDPSNLSRNPEIFWESSPDNPHISIKKDESNIDLRGTYVLHALALENDLHYTLSYRFGGNDQLLYIQSGYPQQLTIESNKAAYLVYKLQDFSAFRLLISEQRGDTVTSAIAIDLEDIDAVSKVSPWEEVDEDYFSIIQVSESQLRKACEGFQKCGIQFKIFAQTHTKVSLILNDSKDGNVYLPPNTQVIDQLLIKDSLGVLIQDDQQVEFDIRVFKGKIEIKYQESMDKWQTRVYEQDLKTQYFVVPAIGFSTRMILIKALQSSVFQIHYAIRGSYKQLTYGLPHFVQFMNTAQVKEFKIINNPEQYSGKMEISIQHKLKPNYANASFKHLDDQLVQVEFFFESFDNKRQQLGTSNAIQFNENLYYELDPINDYGQVIIQLKINQSIYKDYYITVTEEGQSQILIPDYEKRGMGDRDENRIYQLLVNDDNYVILEESFCEGSGHISAASRKDLLEDGSSDISLKQLTPHDKVKYHMIPESRNSDNIYVNLRIQQDSTIYSVTPYYFHNSQRKTPFDIVEQPRDNGIIRWRYNSTTEEMKFLVSALYADYEELKEAGWIIQGDNYQFSYSNDYQILENVSMCKTRLGSNLSVQNYFVDEKNFGYDKDQQKQLYAEFFLSKSEFLQIQDRLDNGDGQFYVKVVAQIHMKNTLTSEIQTFKFPFENTEVPIDAFFPERQSSSLIWYIILIGILAIGLGYIVYKFTLRYFIIKREAETGYGNLQTTQSFVEMK